MNTIGMITAPDNKACYCKYFEVDVDWLKSLGLPVNIYDIDLNDASNQVNRTVYERAKDEGRLLRAVDTFSSRQHDDGSVIGEILTEQENGEQYYHCEKGVSEQGFIFKDPVAFRNKKGICYIPERDFFEDGFTYNEFLEIAEGSDDVAEMLFEMVDWQSPYSLLDELFVEGELNRCPSCGKLYLSYDKPVCDNCKDVGVVMVEKTKGE